jgi:hypothetical protein
MFLLRHRAVNRTNRVGPIRSEAGFDRAGYCGDIRSGSEAAVLGNQDGSGM